MRDFTPNRSISTQHQVIVLSQCPRFLEQVARLTFDCDIYQFKMTTCLPDPSTLDVNVFYAVIMDIGKRPPECLQWIADTRSQGFAMPMLAVNASMPKQKSRLISKAYGMLSWQNFDLDVLTASKLTHAVSLLFKDYDLTLANEIVDDTVEDFSLAINVIEEAVIKVDTQLRIQYLNTAAQELLGETAKTLLGDFFLKRYTFFDDITKTSLNTVLERKLNGDVSYRLDGPLLLLGNNVQIGYVGIACAPIFINGGDLVGFFIILRDLTEHQSLSSKLHYHSSHDQLSGLLSRMEFEARLQQAINSANESSSDKSVDHVLIFLDIDQFRIINETCGHAVGDELIRQFSFELRSIVRKRDTLARIGGDEFAIILWNCPESKGIEIANNVRAHIEAFRFVWIDKVHQVTVSVGLTPIKADTLSSWAEALRLVDGACDAAKEAGRNRVELTDPADQRMHDRHGEMEWVHRLIAAVEGKGLILYCQAIQPMHLPISDISSHTHFEVLVRYQDADDKLVPPGVFLPPAERYNLMGMLDRWVVKTTLLWIAAQGPEFHIDICSINLSGASMCDSGMPNYIKNIFAETGVNPKCICFEITETVAVTNITSATEFIRDLKHIGCKFALDDFGVGMSSFAYLKHMDVDFVKIDGSFVKNIVSDPIDKEMVRSINDIGHILGKQTVAEFCEDVGCYDMLSHLGVDYVQGYFIGKPHPIEMIAKKL